MEQTQLKEEDEENLVGGRRPTQRFMRVVQHYSSLIATPAHVRRSSYLQHSNEAELGVLRVVQSDVGDGGHPPYIFPRSQNFFVPFFVISASIIELLVFLYHVINLKVEHCIEIDAMGPVPMCSVLIYNPQRRYEAWRFLSYMLVHAGYIHIASNIVVLLMLGVPLEIVHGPLRIGTIYLSGVLTGALACSVSDPHSYLAGASGGVYAVLVAHLPTMIMNCRQMKTAVEWMVSVLTIAVGLVDLSMAVYHRYISDRHLEDSVGYAAHLGGATAGLLVGMNVLRNFETLKWENYLRLASFLLFVCLIVTGILVNALAGDDFFPRPDHDSIDDCKYFPGCAFQEIKP